LNCHSIIKDVFLKKWIHDFLHSQNSVSFSSQEEKEHLFNMVRIFDGKKETTEFCIDLILEIHKILE